MRFKTVADYDNEIKRIDEILDNFKEYIENYPEKIGVQGNYELLKYIREELKKERKELKIKELRKRYKLEGVLE